jgi:hypothetical protein
MRYRTNIQPQKPTRRKPQEGEVFAFYVQGCGWLFGRLARLNCLGALQYPLIYVYRAIQPAPHPIPTLDKRDLLVPPMFVVPQLWTLGYFVAVREGPAMPGDVFDRHCFDTTFGTYVDEDYKRVDTPFEPCGHTGLSGPMPFDDDISDALGIPRVPDDEKLIKTKSPRGQVKDGAGEVAVYIPRRESKRTVESIEEQIRIAVEGSGAGVWEGHGFDLDKGLFDTRFQGKSRRRLLDAVRRAVASLKSRLPEGSYAVVRPRRGDWEERVEL